jgi:hypothetical protein
VNLEADVKQVSEGLNKGPTDELADQAGVAALEAVME